MKLLAYKRGNSIQLSPNELAESVKDGEYFVELKKHHNWEFHKKCFALINAAFLLWEAPEGANKSIDVFRDELTVLCGHYETVFSLDGTFKTIPKSWSYARMAEIEKEALYSKLIDVILLNVLPTHDRESLLKMESKILEFA